MHFVYCSQNPQCQASQADRQTPWRMMPIHCSRSDCVRWGRVYHSGHLCQLSLASLRDR